MGNNFKIDFIGIGAMKSATTWISCSLVEHPEICVYPKKGVHFFDKPYNYRKGIGYYESFFRNCSKDKIIGEITPDYIYNENASERIYKYFPDVKIIVCLRDPIERAYSHYRAVADFGRGRVSIYKDFREALKKDPVLIEKGFYFKQLRRFFDRFPRENILVMLYGDIKKDPIKFIQDIYKFLGASYNFEPSVIKERKNPTGGLRAESKIPLFDLICWRYWNLINTPTGYGRLYSAIDRIGLRKIGRKMLRWNRKKINVEDKRRRYAPSFAKEIDLGTKEYLRNIFKDDIKKLEKLIEKDLKHWG